MDTDTFRAIVFNHYSAHARSMPWRTNTDPYHVLVSEMMLQQTQVNRVTPKFLEFIERFPTVQDLASASLQEVLKLWSGLGYNRRAKYLHEAARMVVSDFGGKVPNILKELVYLPGIGPNTAGAVMAYAYNQPVLFIETNIRTVYIHHFFHDRGNVDDKEILTVLAETMSKENPREWYWALMDYGSHLKAKHPNPSRKSKHHSVQSRFEGSTRQLRGRVLKLLIENSRSEAELLESVNDSRLLKILDTLEHEKLINKQNGIYSIS